MKALPISPFLRCICLLVAVISLLSVPTVVVTAATGTATCPGGETMHCNAYRCDCMDNVGCTGYDQYGVVVSTKACPADERQPESGPVS